MYDQYNSARRVGASGLLKKNKGIMLAGKSGDACQARLRGLSGGDWVTSTVGITLGASEIIILPIQVYGVTLGSGGAVFELN